MQRATGGTRGNESGSGTTYTSGWSAGASPTRGRYVSMRARRGGNGALLLVYCKYV